MHSISRFCLLLPLASLAAAQSQPASAPAADGRTPLLASVIEVVGDVQYAPLGSTEWKPLTLESKLPEETKIRTGLRSSAKLRIGDEQPETLLVIDSVGLTVLSEAAKTLTDKKVRVGVGYGRVRGGVAEGGLRSDFTVDSPVATLSKKGTWGFSLYYERTTDIFEIALADEGLVQALNKISQQSRDVAPGEFVTNAMRRWLDQAEFMRNVPVADIPGQGDVEIAFNRLQQDGLGVLNPGGGRGPLLDLNGAGAQGEFQKLIEQVVGNTIIPPVSIDASRRLRAEGFFGSGRGDDLIPVLIDATNPLVQKGAAQPGRLIFRRSALQEWMASRK